eukprot:CAMPEP_0174267662 /NCGR_PEP_ID=MMETSP0439-20130205/34434_1 /TAXON_ID=0 /ORGANISM="Stereomyxa ramosa, Strain Chinc5" /LENGTH=474 /DNA_ID=CAMNT_0015355277 /DNA_START=564 /DNA_END=1985 /DNA_ORIENTATION=+
MTTYLRNEPKFIFLSEMASVLRYLQILIGFPIAVSLVNYNCPLELGDYAVFIISLICAGSYLLPLAKILRRNESNLQEGFLFYKLLVGLGLLNLVMAYETEITNFICTELPLEQLKPVLQEQFYHHLNRIIQTSALLIGIASVLSCGWVSVLRHWPQSSPRHFITLSCFATCLCATSLSPKVAVSLSVVYLGVTLYGFLITINCFPGRSSRWRKLFALNNIILIVVCILLDWQIPLIIGFSGLFLYFSHLAYYAFRGSTLFPLVLTTIGAAIIAIGVQIQEKGEWVRGIVYASSPLNELGSLVLSSCITIFFFALYWFVGWKKLNRWGLPDLNGPPKLQIKTIVCTPPDNPSHQGLKLIFRGTKPSDFQITQAHLYFASHSFWRSVRRIYGTFPVYLFQLTMCPVKLCPDYLNKDDIKAGKTTFQSSVAIKRTMKQILINLGSGTIPIVATYSSNSGSGILFRAELSIDRILLA